MTLLLSDWQKSGSPNNIISNVGVDVGKQKPIWGVGESIS